MLLHHVNALTMLLVFAQRVVFCMLARHAHHVLLGACCPCRLYMHHGIDRTALGATRPCDKLALWRSALVAWHTLSLLRIKSAD